MQVLRSRDGQLVEEQESEVYCFGCGIFLADLGERVGAVTSCYCPECRRFQPLVRALEEIVRGQRRIETAMRSFGRAVAREQWKVENERMRRDLKRQRFFRRLRPSSWLSRGQMWLSARFGG